MDLDTDLIDLSVDDNYCSERTQPSQTQTTSDGFRYPNTSHNFKLKRHTIQTNETTHQLKSGTHIMTTSQPKNVITRDNVLHFDSNGKLVEDPLEVFAIKYPNLCQNFRLRTPKIVNTLKPPMTPKVYESGHRLRRPKIRQQTDHQFSSQSN